MNKKEEGKKFAIAFVRFLKNNNLYELFRNECNNLNYDYLVAVTPRTYCIHAYINSKNRD